MSVRCLILHRVSSQGSADPLNSAFHLTYNMVLNLLRVEEINPEYMLEKSFYQFQHYRAVPGVVESMFDRTADVLREHYFPVFGFLDCDLVSLCSVYVFLTEMKKLEEDYNAIQIPNEESVVTYYKIRQQLAKLGKEIEDFIHKPRYCLPFLQPGRLVRVNISLFFSSL